MEEAKRITGFMPMAKDIIAKHPGLTAEEVYHRVAKYAEDAGVPISASPNPKGSLVPTLNKVYRDYGLERRKGNDRKFRFYLKGQEPSDVPVNDQRTNYSVDEQPPLVDQKPHEGYFPPHNSGDDAVEDISHSTQTFLVEGSCCLRLAEDERKKIRALVDLKEYPDEHEAHSGLVKLGLETFLSRLPL